MTLSEKKEITDYLNGIYARINKAKTAIREMNFGKADDILSEDDAYWPGGDIGSVAVWEDGTAYNIHDIRYVVDNNIPKETVEAWWDYSYQIAYINSEYHALQNYKELPNVSLESYCKGVRTLTQEELDAEYDLIINIQNAKDEFNTSIESYENQHRNEV